MTRETSTNYIARLLSVAFILAVMIPSAIVRAQGSNNDATPSHRIAFQTMTVASAEGYVLKTTDGGTTWTLVHATSQAGASERTSAARRVEDAGMTGRLHPVGVVPNPVVNTATIHYRLSQPGEVAITVYDALGREVARMTDGLRSEGEHSIPFHASNLPDGVYCYRVTNSAIVIGSDKVVVRH